MFRSDDKPDGGVEGWLRVDPAVPAGRRSIEGVQPALLHFAERKRPWRNAVFKHFSVENSLTIWRLFEYVCAHFRGPHGSALARVGVGVMSSGSEGAGSVDWKGGGQCER